MNEIDLMQQTPDEILNNLEAGVFHNLEGITVTVRNLGNVGGGQQDYRDDAIFQEKLINFWKAYFAECGATMNGEIQIAPRAGMEMVCNTESKNPYPDVDNITFKIDIAPPQSEIIPIRSDTLDFLPNSANFKDEAKADSAIGNYSKHCKSLMENDPEMFFYVVGSVAESHKGEELLIHDPIAGARASAVASKLVSVCGIPQDRIVVIDGGTYRFSWRPYDAYALPRDQVDAALQANRVVTVVPSTATDSVEELREGGYID